MQRVVARVDRDRRDTRHQMGGHLQQVRLYTERKSAGSHIKPGWCPCRALKQRHRGHDYASTTALLSLPCSDSANSANSASAAWRSSTISAAIAAGDGRLSVS